MIKPISFCSTKLNVVYFNDMHSSPANIDRFASAMQDSDLVLSGGDLFVGKAVSNPAIGKILQTCMDASAAGNHDLECGQELSQLLSGNNLKMLGVNVSYSKETALSRQIQSSIILDKNIGVIGVAPFDYEDLAFINDSNDFIKIEPVQKTVDLVKQEVEKLEKQGVDKIFLLAHTGKEYYEMFAKIGGIDVIIGGHDHTEVDSWATSDRNEPVKIAATGGSDKVRFDGNLNVFGRLKLYFDDFGVLVKQKCDNLIEQTQNYPCSGLLGKFKPADKAAVIAKLPAPVICGDPLIQENKVANIVADSSLWYVNTHTKGEKADFSFVNAGSIRDNFNTKEVTLDDTANIAPFDAVLLIKTNLSKKQIIDTLNWCVESTTLPKISPGLMQVSGLEYKINDDLTVSGVHILDADGSIKYDLDDFDDDKEFVCVYDTFLATGVAGLKDLKKDNPCEMEIFDCSRQKALSEYLQNVPKIFDYERARIK